MPSWNLRSFKIDQLFDIVLNLNNFTDNLPNAQNYCTELHSRGSKLTIIGSDNGSLACHMVSAKPLFEPMLEYC